MVHCGPGTVFRRGYTRKVNGKYVRPACIVNRKTRSNKSRNNKTVRRNNKISCPPGQIPRSGYVRQVSSRIQRNGYTRKTKSGSMVRIYPKAKPIYVKSSCVKDVGKPGKLPEGAPKIGPLKKGELKRFGYSYKLPEGERRTALQSAIQQLGPLDVYRKLNAVSKLTERTSPSASSSFSSDRNWIRKTYAGANGSLQAF